MRVACYADDPKEPELIGDCYVQIDEVLRKGEVDGELTNLLSGSWELIPRRMVRVHLQGEVCRGDLP